MLEDVLPEAVIVKNIVGCAFSDVCILLDLNSFFSCGGIIEPTLQTDCVLKQKLIDFREALNLVRSNPSREPEASHDNYDADSEARPDEVSRSRTIERKGRGSRSYFLAPEPAEDKTIMALSSSSRTLLLLLQSDRRYAESLRLMLSTKAELELPDVGSTFESFHDFAVERVMQPFGSRLALLQALCHGIVLRQNAQKRAHRLRAILDDIETKRQMSMSEKTKEKQELQDAIAAVRSQSRQKISEFRAHVDNKLKVMAWNSHGRLTKTLEHVNELKRELAEAIRDHTEAETNMRHANIKLQNEVDDMIKRYDREMFQKRATIEKIKAEYEEEKLELSSLMEKLAEVDVERSAIEDENRIAAEKKRDEELQNIRRIVAAKVIQRAWRAYRTRMLLKSKKKRGRKRQ